MEEVAIIICTWLHLIVLVVWVGHMVNSLILFEPLSSKYVSKVNYSDFIAEYRRRDRPVAISCIVIFIITGIVLAFLDEQYKGLGNIFTNNWSIILFVKHILVLCMIVLGIYQGTRVMPSLAEAARKSTGQRNEVQKVSVMRLENTRKTVTRWLCGLALVVLLLTAVGESI